MMEKKGKHIYPIAWGAGLLVLAFTLLCRFSTGVADFYSLSIYPTLSAILSWVASPVDFSLQDIALILIVTMAIAVVVTTMVKKQGLKRCLMYEALILLWTYNGFYMTWCNNYYRSSIYQRTTTSPATFDEEIFQSLLKTYTSRINAEWTRERAETGARLEEEIKAYYNRVPASYGLAEARTWQHPKSTLFNPIYSAVGIQGFMEPLLAESCINHDVQAFDYPFVYAHEYAHLLGISSEAECNWWAYYACLSSEQKAVRYSALKNILPHLMRNAHRLLTAEAYEAWIGTLRPEILDDLRQTSIHWEALRSPIMRKVHELTYDLFLKGNNIQTGLQNYSEVVGMLLSLKPA